MQQCRPEIPDPDVLGDVTLRLHKYREMLLRLHQHQQTQVTHELSAGWLADDHWHQPCMSHHVHLVLASSWFMRDPLPLVVASTTGGFGALAIEFLRATFRESVHGIPAPSDCPVPGLLSGDPSLSLVVGFEGLQLHLPSILLGIALGFLLGPLVDLCFLLRYLE